MAAFLRRNAWLIPVLFALLLGGVGFSSYRALEKAMKAQIASKLETVRDASIAALEIWAEENRAVADVFSLDPRVRKHVRELLRVARSAENPREALMASPTQESLRRHLAGIVERHGYAGFGVVDPTGMFVASSRDRSIGRRIPGITQAVAPILEGRTLVTPPRAVLLSTEDAPEALMIVGAPVRADDGTPVAAFGFSIDPAREFARILTVARTGESGETYAFDARGLLVSPSRFDDQLRELGLLPDDPNVHSILNIQVRDPGGNLAEGFEPTTPLKARPLTIAAASAAAGEQSVDVEGFRDYRGIPVAGAWAWIPELGIGVTSEIDIDEAYAGLYVLRRRFGVVIGVLAVAALGIFLYSFVVMRLRRQVDAARQVGRYRIERKLGSGGMGTVYLARHALLRRPTAIKILSEEKAGREGLARFEREVQVSSVLSHPNTIEIYDFGHTPEGTFYYAMELVKGITLGTCVQTDGPQPEARVLHVIRQACGSIAEAHAAGLMHRDLKPSNIMLCERGGTFDFAKVLDFGLVKELQQSGDVALTDVASLTGTPLYMPPEAAQAPETLDVRGDVYQLGLVAYYLLVGRHLFQGDTPVDVVLQHVSATPVPPSQALGRHVAADLEKVILRCLEKNPADRFADARELLEALESCSVEGVWTQREARAWWTLWRERNPEAEDETPSTTSGPSGYSIDLAERIG